MTFWNWIAVVEAALIVYLLWVVAQYGHAIQSILDANRSTQKRIDAVRKGIGFDAMVATPGEVEERLAGLGLDKKAADPKRMQVVSEPVLPDKP